MCGILFRLQFKKSATNDSFHNDLWNQLMMRNKQRGPDSQGELFKSIQSQFSSLFTIDLTFFGAVLHLRGPSVVKQPLTESDEQDVLLWNGEIFNGVEIPSGENDTKYLFAALKESHKVENDNEDEDKILHVLRNIEGPYAIVYWQSSKRRLWFGRDCLGRRSLLWHLPSEEEDDFILTSVGCKVSQTSDTSLSPYFAEVPADGIFYLDLDKMLSSASSEPFENFLIHHKWHRTLPFGRVNDTLPSPEDLSQLPTSLDLSNTSFIPIISPKIQDAVNKLIEELGDSVRRRIIDIPQTGSIQDARVAIMFSGGLDCICLAALADKYIPKEEAIDLLNVGFENPRIQQKNKDKKKNVSHKNDSIYDVPDRLTGRQGVEELRKIAPGRIWNFVEVNVPYEEACTFKPEIIELMAPSDTIMDLSIAMAFWFAARGKGQIASLDNTKIKINYESKARVLLVGIGADELLGGYSRHREAFRQCGWQKLIEEVQLDVDRISTRNLGRDDRIISSHSKESRFPYLASNVVSFLCSLPMYIKADMRYERGIGEKLLLRHVARQLGLSKASSLWKRAIQFGAKTAKMTNENSKERGNMRVC
ncbi:asparagine synthase-domain-containing protein [Glomus cerebriforme]|uniref:Asparagine synthase-domain-containing protein n=1 Tax=Glomus cerebriforme TaxID=658196 RepID=A0A397TCW2_9GLOM|nr:asparagine synthase-domain-containing protein [Glomus cerebriforme]